MQYLLSAPHAEQKAFAWHSVHSSDATVWSVSFVQASASSGLIGRRDTPGSKDGALGAKPPAQKVSMVDTACHSQGRSQLNELGLPLLSAVAQVSSCVVKPSSANAFSSTSSRDPPLALV